MGIAKVFLAMGIAIVFAVFIGYGLYVVYEPPNDYDVSNCSIEFNCDKLINECTMNQTINQTVAVDGNFVTKPMYYGGDDCWSKFSQTPEYKKCIEDSNQCEEDFKLTTAKYRYSRNSFFILMIIGMISMIVGLFLSKMEGIGSGFIGGGILVILWSLIYTADYWFMWNKYVKLVMLGIALVLLVYFGYKKLEKRL